MRITSLVSFLSSMGFGSALGWDVQDALNNLSSTSPKSDASLVLAGLARNTEEISPDMFDFIAEMNCVHSIPIHLVTKEAGDFEAMLTDVAIEKYPMHLCAKVVATVQPSVLDIDRVGRIQELREFQKSEIRTMMAAEGVQDLEKAVVILVDFDLGGMPTATQVMKHANEIRQGSITFDSLCANGVVGYGHNANRYYDTYATVLLPDTFVYPVEWREINEAWPDEDAKLIVKPGAKDSFNEIKLFEWLQTEGNVEESSEATKPVPVRSCFGGMAMYRASKYLDERCTYSHGKNKIENAKYRNRDDKDICEHVLWNKCMQHMDPNFKVAIQPDLITTYNKFGQDGYPGHDLLPRVLLGNETFPPTPSNATEAPSTEPTSTPSVDPTSSPSVEPTSSPSVEPTSSPSVEPTSSPSAEPTSSPSVSPTAAPSTSPSASPTAAPSVDPTSSPSASPTLSPSATPSSQPSDCSEDLDAQFFWKKINGKNAFRKCSWLKKRSDIDTICASTVSVKRAGPAREVCLNTCDTCFLLHPSQAPSSKPSSSPTMSPSAEPTSSPSAAPTSSPSVSPTAAPSVDPTAAPSSQPSACSEDPDAFFFWKKINGKNAFRKCSWLKKRDDIDTICASTVSVFRAGPAREVCLNTCDTCFLLHPSQMPSSAPVASPSVSPSASPSVGPTTSPSASPSVSPTTSPSASPSVSPTTSPSASPTAPTSSCQENGADEFYWYTQTKDPFKDVKRSCDWLKENASKISSICSKTENAPSDGTPPAQEVCQVTCGTCSEMPSSAPVASPSVSPSAIPSASPTTLPSASPSVSCQENGADEFYWYTQTKDPFKDVKRSCDWLKENASKISSICSKTENAPSDGTPPAQEVCQVTCGTC